MRKNTQSKADDGLSQFDDPEVDKFTARLVKRKARQLVGRAGFVSSDREDIEQDLSLKLTKQLSAFDPRKGSLMSFITTVVERHAATLIRNKNAEKRDHRRICSLNVTIEVTDEGPTELVQTIGDRELDARLGRRRRSECELVQLALDLASVMATLPHDWQTLLERRKTQTMADIARELGVPRTTLNEWMRRIRKRFEKAGLNEYLRR